MINLPEGLTYNPEFFNSGDLADAKRIVLGHGISETSHKWEVETQWIELLFKRNNFINRNSIVLDFGVGVGRLSKMMIDAFDCTVVGVDISEKMLNHATEYVGNSKFIPMTIDELKITELAFTNAIAVWTLQHSIDVVGDLSLIKRKLASNSRVFVFEEKSPCIPVQSDTNIPWFILKRSNFNVIEKTFKLEQHSTFPRHLNITENNNSWYGFYKNYAT